MASMTLAVSAAFWESARQEPGEAHEARAPRGRDRIGPRVRPKNAVLAYS